MTIEDLEKNYWGNPPGDATSLIQKCFLLRKKDINKFDVEDCRILINQNISLNIVLPIAYIILQNNILAEGDYYEGDLLKSILSIDNSFWIKNSYLRNPLINLLKEYVQKIEHLDSNSQIKEEIIELKNSFLEKQDNIQ